MTALAQGQDERPAPPPVEQLPVTQAVEHTGQSSGPLDTIGDGVRQGVHEVGRTARQVGTGIGHAARDSAHAVGKGVTEAVRGVGSATRNAVDEVKQPPTPTPVEPAQPAPAQTPPR